MQPLRSPNRLPGGSAWNNCPESASTCRKNIDEHADHEFYDGSESSCGQVVVAHRQVAPEEALQELVLEVVKRERVEDLVTWLLF